MSSRPRKPIKPGTKKAVWDKTDGACWYCGRQVAKSVVTEKARTNIEHLVPVSQGGGDQLENLVLACWGCNISKGPHTPDEYRQREAEDHADRIEATAAEFEWAYSHFAGDAELEAVAHLRGVAAHVRRTRVVFYGERLMIEDPNNYVI